LRSPEFIEAWQRIRADDPEEDACIRVAVKQAKPSGVLLADLDKAVRGDEAGGEDIGTADVLIALVLKQTDLFHDAEKAAYATIKTESESLKETFQLGTQAFGDWLSYAYYSSTAEKSKNGIGSSVGKATLKAALIALAGIAKHGNEERPCYLRAAPWSEDYIIDLGDSWWQAAEILPTGWRIVDTPPVRFWRPNTSCPLPVPVSGGDLSALWQFANIPEQARPLVLAWMLEALRPYALRGAGAVRSARLGQKQHSREIAVPDRPERGQSARRAQDHR
jgi:hypothetical protein